MTPLTPLLVSVSRQSVYCAPPRIHSPVEFKPVLVTPVVIKATGTPCEAMCSVANKGHEEPSAPVLAGSVRSAQALAPVRHTDALSVAWE